MAADDSPDSTDSNVPGTNPPPQVPPAPTPNLPPDTEPAAQ